MRSLVTIPVMAVVLLPLSAGDHTETKRMMLVN